MHDDIPPAKKSPSTNKHSNDDLSYYILDPRSLISELRELTIECIMPETRLPSGSESSRTFALSNIIKLDQFR